MLLAAIVPCAHAQVEAQAAPEALLALKAGEILLEGTVDKVEADGSGLAMSATSFALPNGRAARLAAPRVKAIRVGPDTLLFARGATEPRLLLKRLQPGWFIAAIGEDKGPGQPLTARSVAVWSSVRDGKYLLDAPQADKEPAPAAPPIPPAPPAPPATPPAATRAVRSVLENGSFEEMDGGLRPEGWQVPRGAAVSVVEDEEGNHYILLKAVGEGDGRKISRSIQLNPAWKTLKVSARVRARGLQPPPQPFQDAHVGVVFQDATGHQVGLTGPIALAGDTDWEPTSGICEIPPGAAVAVVDAGNFGSAGEMGLDDLSVEPDGAPDSSELRPQFPEGAFEQLSPNGRAQGWPILGASMVRIEQEGRNHFLHLSRPEPGFAGVDCLVRIAPGTHSLQVQARMRTSDLKTGAQPWECARLGLTFTDSKGVKVGDWPPALQMTSNSDWTVLSQTFPVPEGAALLKLSPSLLNSSGTLDIDDIQVTPLP